MVEVAYAGSRGRQLPLKVDPEPGAADARRHRQQRQPAVHPRVAGSCARSGSSVEPGLRRLQRAARQVPASICEQFLDRSTSYTFGRAERLQLGQRRHRDADQHLQPGIRPRPGAVRRHAHLQLELDLRAPVGQTDGSMAGGRWPALSICAAVADLPMATSRTSQNMLSTTASRTTRPNNLRSEAVAIRPSTCGSTPRASSAGVREHRHVRQRRPQHGSRPGRSSTSTRRSSRTTRIGRYETELRLEIFNVLNNPQFAQPNGQLGNPQFGVVSAMLASPSCAFCGTIERQIQIAVKVRF